MNRPELQRPLEPLAAGPAVSIVIPTYNERDNVPVLIDRLREVLAGTHWEAIVVDDDSPDHTADVARAIGAGDRRVRCIRRVGRRGLSGACLEGMLASQSPIVAVIDADLQHDDRLLPAMLATLQRDEADLVIGTRVSPDGSPEGMSAGRGWMSRFATWLGQAVLSQPVTDPMSGFFMLKRELIERVAPRLSNQGFKILLDIVMTAESSLRIKELPYRFSARQHGESKLGALVVLDFVGLLLAKATNDVLSGRFVLFCVIGSVGIGVHFVALAAAFRLAHLSFTWAQTVATAVAIASNFVLHNLITYGDQRLRGWRIVLGMLQFYVVCLIGASANIGVSQWIFSNDPIWWVAGLAGGILGVIWNYLAASTFIWRTR
jgi:dolichol-phosphate mannosyltransferase